MEIENTPWKTICYRVEDKNYKEGRLESFGYEAPASPELLKKLQANGIYIQLVSDKGPQWIMPNNKSPQVLRGKKFRILLENETYPAFEKMLKKDSGKEPPETRFDEFIEYTDPSIWKIDIMTGSLFLNLNAWPISKKKKQALKEFFEPEGFRGKPYGKCVGNRIFVSGENIDVLKHDWACGALQKRLRKEGKHPIIHLDEEPKPSLRKDLSKKMASSKSEKTLWSAVFNRFKKSKTTAGK